jgi:hypothetical protein
MSDEYQRALALVEEYWNELLSDNDDDLVEMGRRAGELTAKADSLGIDRALIIEANHQVLRRVAAGFGPEEEESILAECRNLNKKRLN